MFTGIIESTGTVESVADLDETREIVVRAPEICSELSLGDSIAVDGACLTVVEFDESTFRFDVIGTTLSRTIAGRYEIGSRVNLERAMRLGERLDGHLVQGHVDGLGELVGSEVSGDYYLMDFRIPEEVEEITILHGSIAINGVSLTVSRLPGDGSCRIGIIPHTWKVTNLGDLEPGEPVNLEGDLIGKYVGKMLAGREMGPLDDSA